MKNTPKLTKAEDSLLSSITSELTRRLNRRTKGNVGLEVFELPVAQSLEKKGKLQINQLVRHRPGKGKLYPYTANVTLR